MNVLKLFLWEAGGGAVLGLAVGMLGFRMLSRVDDYQVEVIITLAMVMGGYALAGSLHASGPIATVIAGLLIGSRGRARAMSDTTRERLDSFWELVDEILNALLFMLIGLEIQLIPFEPLVVAAGLGAAAATLVARGASVGTIVGALRWTRKFTRGTTRVLTWGGIRGGIAIALALSLPASPYRDTLLVITYVVVIFSVVAQGLSLGWVVGKVFEDPTAGRDG